MSNNFMHEGTGYVPKVELSFGALMKQFVEYTVDDGFQSHIGMNCELEFTSEGISSKRLENYINNLMRLDGAKEPIIQSGGIYGVSSEFGALNAKLLVFQLRQSDLFKALSEKDQTRAIQLFSLFLENDNLRNRNPIHPSVIDSCLISNLLNFPKHLFGFPYACYATDGNESLSLVLFAYLQKAKSEKACKEGAVLYVGSTPPKSLKFIVERLTMNLIPVTQTELLSMSENDLREVVCALVDLDDNGLSHVAGWCSKFKLGCHVHISTLQWKNIFLLNTKPVHYRLPQGITSVSIDPSPMLSSGYSLYKEYTLRDYHMDVPSHWQTVYLSPNEGGSNSARPLFKDLCTLLLGWNSMRELAIKLNEVELDERTLRVSHYTPRQAVYSGHSLAETVDWAYEKTQKKHEILREDLEIELVRFQMEFLGGQDRELDIMTTGGGTRSINLSFQAVLARERSCGNYGPYKVVTGNPHLAVERAERRFGFELVRTEANGSISVDEFKAAIKDPAVIAVYTQSLSYTDGITDPLCEIY